MGKIRVKTIGIEDEEKKNQAEAKKRAEAKKLESKKASEEIATSQAPRNDKEEAPKAEKKPMVKKQKGDVQKKTRSEKYKTALKLVDTKKVYALKEALEILPKLKVANFDETVELHINTIETGMSGTISLPHGTGKAVKVAIADDGVIESIQNGKIDFDILVATPQMMPKLARVAKILGPKGLMPNPKNGTVTANPEEVAKKFADGQMRYKTEAKNPLMHVIVGKVSFGDTKLSENIKAMLAALGMGKIKKVTLKSTMSPALHLDFTTIK